jgi:hypothetical protein
MLRIQKADAVHPHPFTALGWQVRRIRRMITGLTRRGVVFERYAFLEQDAPIGGSTVPPGWSTARLCRTG